MQLITVILLMNSSKFVGRPGSGLVNLKGFFGWNNKLLYSYQHSQMTLFRIPFINAYDALKIPYEDRKAHFGRQHFLAEGGVAQRVGSSCVMFWNHVAQFIRLFVEWTSDGFWVSTSFNSGVHYWRASHIGATNEHTYSLLICHPCRSHHQFSRDTDRKSVV